MTSLLEKVKKLRQLMTSSNAGEAAAAAAAVERLIQRHNLQEAELETASPAPDEVTRGEAMSLEGWRIPTWVNTLLVTLQQAYQCDGFFEQVVAPDGHKSMRFVSYGRLEDIEMVKFQYAWFSSEVTRLTSSNSRRGVRYANSYRMGVVMGIRSALALAQQAERGKATARALAVVDTRAEQASAAMLQQNEDLCARPTALKSPDPWAFAAGFRDGESIRRDAELDSTTRAAKRLKGK